MVLSAIWSLAFGSHNTLPDTQDTEDAIHNDNVQEDDIPSHDALIEKIVDRQRTLTEAEREILATTVYLPAPNTRDEAAENKSGFILVVTSLTLNNIGCYPFFGIRDRHQVFPRLFPETSPRSSLQYLRQVYRSQGVLGIWYGMPCSMICHTCTIFYEAFLNSIIWRFRKRSRKILPKNLIYLSTRVNSLLLRMDYRAGPWPSNSSYLYLLKSFFVDYVHDLIGLVYGGGRSPSALPLVSTVLPSYALNLLFEIIQTWIFRWIYPRLVPSSFFSKKKSRKSSSPAPLLSPMPLRNTSSSGASNSDQRRYSGARSRRSSSRTRQPSTRHHPTDETSPSTTATLTPDASTTAITAGEISATIMAAMPTVSSNTPTTTTQAINRARRGLRYLSTVAPRSPTLLQEFYPEMVCAMTSSMMTRILLYPLDTVASRVSAQGGSFPGIGASPTVYSGLWDCCVRSVRTEGVLGLYSGVIDCIIVEGMVRWVVLEGTWFAHLLIKWLHRR